MRRIVAAVVCALVLAACGGDDGAGPPATSLPSTTASPTTVPVTTMPSTTMPSTTLPEPTLTQPTGPTVQVFFVDQDAFNQGVPPYAIPVDRPVGTASPAETALTALFAGPTAEESAGGLVFVSSEATGFRDLRIVDGTAHVTLTGGCSSGGSTLTIAAEIVPTLLQFAAVDAVKIYDPDGATQVPDAPGDSVPDCLEP